MFTSQNDLNNLVVRVLIPIVGSIGAAFATVWLLQSINPLAAFAFLVAAVFFFVAVVSPRSGLYLLIGTCAYSDLIKRLLVIFGELSFDQIAYVLMIAPIIVIGLLTSIITRRAFHQLQLNRGDIILGCAAVVMGAANFIISVKANGTMLEAAKNAVNNGVFAGSAVVALRAFRDEEDLERFIRVLLCVFLPVPLYALWQLAFGFADYEVEYLRSGLSIEIKQLYEIRPRPFSTLNSAGVLGTLCAALFILSLYPWIVRRYRAFRPRETVGSILCALIFFAGAVGSLVRSSHAVWLIAGVCLCCFGSRLRTRIFYVGAVSMLLFIILGASWIQEWLPYIDPAQFASSDYGTASLSILTYNDRLNGFINMTASTDMYSWFGIPESRQGFGSTFSHDPISGLIMKVGVVGFAAIAACLVLGLRWIHSHLLGLPPGRRPKLAVLLTSGLVGWLFTEILVSWVISTFPLNVIFWLFVGAVGFLLATPVTDAPAGERSNETDDNPDREPAWRPKPALSGAGRWDLSRRRLP